MKVGLGRVVGCGHGVWGGRVRGEGVGEDWRLREGIESDVVSGEAQRRAFN